MYGCFGWGDDRLPRVETYENIIKALKDLGISDNEIESVKQKTLWHIGISTMYWNAIKHTLETNIDEPARTKVSGDLQNRMFSWKQSKNMVDWHILTKEEIEKEIIDNNLSIDDNLKSWLDAYGEFCRTGVIQKRNELLKGEY